MPTSTQQPLSPFAKKILVAIGILFLLGAFMQATEKASFCNAHPGGRGFKTLDEKYKWVMECNDGKPAPRP